MLDVAAGTGNASIPAALAGAHVTASDLTPELLEAGRARAEAAGAELEWVEADAERLPFEDESFDVVMSAIGVMFAPHHQLAADELVRVCKPGGTIGLLSWTPEGMIGGLFRTIGPFAPPPPPGAQPPPLWGSEAHLGELLGNRVEQAPASARRARRDRVRAPGRLRARTSRPTTGRRSPRRTTPAPTGARPSSRARSTRSSTRRTAARRAPRASRWSTCCTTGTPRASRPSAARRSAAAPASRREPTPSLPSTAETWWSTVLAEITSSRAISALVAPRTISSSTSVSRGVSPAGPRRDAARGPRGIRLHPGGAQPPPQVRRRAQRAERLEARERLEPRRVVVGVAERLGRS